MVFFQSGPVIKLTKENWIEFLIVPMAGEIYIWIMIDATKMLLAEL